MATPHAVLKHALNVPRALRRSAARSRRLGRLRSGLLVGAAAALTVTRPAGHRRGGPRARPPTPPQAAQLVADANHQLEVVTEQLNEAKVQLEQQQAAVASADQAAADAQAQLDALDGQIRQIARTRLHRRRALPRSTCC